MAHDERLAATGLRDIFAAAAVYGTLVSIVTGEWQAFLAGHPYQRPAQGPTDVAEWAYKIADAMMKERERTPCSPPREPK